MSAIIWAAVWVFGLGSLTLIGMWWADKPNTACPTSPETAEEAARRRDLAFLEAQANAAAQWPRVWDDALRREIPA